MKTSTPTQSKVLSAAIDSVRVPIENFIRTGIFSGIYDRTLVSRDISHSDGCVAGGQVQRIARYTAKELKRPFIIMEPVVRGFTWSLANGRWRKEIHDPRFSHVFVRIPKRKYLMPIAAPLLLAAPEPVTHHRTAIQRVTDPHHDEKFPVIQRAERTNWVFNICSEEFWHDYRAALERPEMRAARKLPPLPDGDTSVLAQGDNPAG